MLTPQVHEYLDFRQFLRDWLEARRAVDPSFSRRKFVKLAGKTSPGLLGDVIDEGRKVGPEMARAFAKAMGLSRSDADFFELLVVFGQASEPEDRRVAWERLATARAFQQSRRIEGRSYAYLTSWWIPVVRELAGRADFQPDPAWIARRVRPAITEAQARKALDTLTELGMLVDKEGVLRPAEGVLTTPHEVASMAVHEYHRGMLRLAGEAIDRFPAEERHLSAATVSIPTRLIPVLKAEIDALQERVLALANGFPEPAEQVLQVQLAMFPLSDRTGDPA